MSENENVNKYKLQFIDKLLISFLGIGTIIVTIITVVVVNNNYKKLYEKKLKELSNIQYNETYKYKLKDNTLIFYKDINEVAKYKCIKDCKITEFASNQFIIDQDDLIPIRDNNNVIIYSISKKENAITLDDIPQTSINNKYGIIKMNNKYGVINKHGKIILKCIYDDVDINTSHIVTLAENIIYVFDNNAAQLNFTVVPEKGDISISEKNNHLYINIIGNKTTTLIFDTNTHKFLN